MFKKLFLGVVGLVGLVAVVNYAIFSPVFEHEVEYDLGAPPARVVAVYQDFRTWDAWSSWSTEDDPDCKFEFQGDPGPGMKWIWSDGKTLGAGSMTITEASANAVSYHLEMTDPMAMALDGGIRVSASGEGTRATWWSKGESDFPLIGRIMNQAFAGAVEADYRKAFAGLDEYLKGSASGGPSGE